jgi:hypothetical protein
MVQHRYARLMPPNSLPPSVLTSAALRSSLSAHTTFVASNTSVSQVYSTAEHRSISDEKPFPPHIQHGNDAYYHMRWTTGGPPKIRAFFEVSTFPTLQIPSAEFVLKSFGNARTLFNPNTPGLPNPSSLGLPLLPVDSGCEGIVLPCSRYALRHLPSYHGPQFAPHPHASTHRVPFQHDLWLQACDVAGFDSAAHRSQGPR